MRNKHFHRLPPLRRRTLLRGVLGGGLGVALGLPTLEAMLNSHGTAYAQDGAFPKRFGFYRVHRVVEGSRDSHYPNALLLDYGLGGNGLFGPPLRDYLVQVYPDDPDLLLGKAYLNILGLRIPANFFVLKRLHQHDYRG